MKQTIIEQEALKQSLVLKAPAATILSHPHSADSNPNPSATRTTLAAKVNAKNLLSCLTSSSDDLWKMIVAAVLLSLSCLWGAACF